LMLIDNKVYKPIKNDRILTSGLLQEYIMERKILPWSSA